MMMRQKRKPPLRGLNEGLNEGAKVFFDVIPLVEGGEKVFCFDSEVAPVNFFCRRMIVKFTDFVLVGEFVGLPDEAVHGGRVENRLEAYPCLDSCPVCLPEAFDSFGWRGRARLPLFGLFNIVGCQGYGKFIVWIFGQQIEVPCGSYPPLGQDLHGEATVIESTNGKARKFQGFVERLIRVAGEAEQDGVFLASIPFPEVVGDSGFNFLSRCGCDELIHTFLSDLWCIAVYASMLTAFIQVESKGAVLVGLSFWFVDY